QLAGELDERSTVAPDDAYGRSKADGELSDANAVTIRCTIIGPPPPSDAQRGLWGFVTSSRRQATIDGYEDQLWSGVLTHQFAEVCAELLAPAAFAAARARSAVHHLAPNVALTKFELVSALRDSLRPDLVVRPVATGRPVRRILVSRYKVLDSLTKPIL